MSHVLKGPPVAGSYRYVLARFDWPPNRTYLVANYGETKKTRVVRWPSGLALPRDFGNANHPSKTKGKVNMAFVQDRHLRDRCIRLGWFDITEQWFENLGHPGSGPTPGVELSGDNGGAMIMQIESGQVRPADQADAG